MAEVHVIGEIVGASGFEASDLCCKWGLAAGPHWRVLEGDTSGHTHVDYPYDRTHTQWAHPVDVHFACRSMQGWPKMHFQVWHRDVFSRNHLVGYGFLNVPTSPGSHELDCATWRPVGSLLEEAETFFLGGGVQVTAPEMVYTATDRYKLRTTSSGTVHVHLNVLLRNFDKFGIEF